MGKPKKSVIGNKMRDRSKYDGSGKKRGALPKFVYRILRPSKPHWM